MYFLSKNESKKNQTATTIHNRTRQEVLSEIFGYNAHMSNSICHSASQSQNPGSACLKLSSHRICTAPQQLFTIVLDLSLFLSLRHVIISLSQVGHVWGGARICLETIRVMDNNGSVTHAWGVSWVKSQPANKRRHPDAVILWTPWPHDVAVTLNQRHWRWFNVVTTSCAQLQWE